MAAAPASTYLTCRRCGKLLHRDQFAPQNRVCRVCNTADHVANRRYRRRTDPAWREKERDWDRARKKRLRAENRGDSRWRQEWAARTVAQLHAAGWSYSGIARASGLAKTTILRWAHGTGTHVKVEAFDRFWRWVGDLRWEQEREGATDE